MAVNVMLIDVALNPFVCLFISFKIAVQGVFGVRIVDAAGYLVKIEGCVRTVADDMPDGHKREQPQQAQYDKVGVTVLNLSQRAFHTAGRHQHEQRVNAIMDGPQSIGIHVMRLYPVNAEKESVNKYEDGERLQTLDGILEEDEEWVMNQLYGNTEDIALFKEFIQDSRDEKYFNNKEMRAKALIDEITSPCLCQTGNENFDAYSKNCLLASCSSAVFAT